MIKQLKNMKKCYKPEHVFTLVTIFHSHNSIDKTPSIHQLFLFEFLIQTDFSCVQSASNSAVWKKRGHLWVKTKKTNNKKCDLGKWLFREGPRRSAAFFVCAPNLHFNRFGRGPSLQKVSVLRVDEHRGRRRFASLGSWSHFIDSEQETEWKIHFAQSFDLLRFNLSPSESISSDAPHPSVQTRDNSKQMVSLGWSTLNPCLNLKILKCRWITGETFELLSRLKITDNRAKEHWCLPQRIFAAGNDACEGA